MKLLFYDLIKNRFNNKNEIEIAKKNVDGNFYFMNDSSDSYNESSPDVFTIIWFQYSSVKTIYIDKNINKSFQFYIYGDASAKINSGGQFVTLQYDKIYTYTPVPWEDISLNVTKIGELSTDSSVIDVCVNLQGGK